MKPKRKPLQFELEGLGEVFNLAVESTTDGERIRREAEETERRQREAAALEVKRQTTMC